MELLSFGTFYLGVEEEQFCSATIHLGNVLLEYTCPKTTSPNGNLPSDDQSGNGETPEGNGAIQEP